jgi:hypothetical protein
VVARAGLNAVVKERIPYLSRESNPGRLTRSLVTALTDLYRLLEISQYTINVMLGSH